MIRNPTIEQLADNLSKYQLNWENILNVSKKHVDLIKHKESTSKDYLDLFRRIHLNEALNSVVPKINGLSRDVLSEDIEDHRLVYDDLNSVYVVDSKGRSVAKYDAVVFADKLPVVVDIKLNSGIHGRNTLKRFFSQLKYLRKARFLEDTLDPIRTNQEIGYVVCVPSLERGKKYGGNNIEKFISSRGVIAHMPFTAEQFKEEGLKRI
ncbi:hypothetical protein JXB27_02690 [Candidatus Woesearchaeota archaeon]|nr:hypothetical protein [Candidatus Woesearchaeota archaeon]